MTTTKTIKLTKAQKAELPRLQVADEIQRGQLWFRKFTGRNSKIKFDVLDSRVCNALVGKGVLVPVGGEFGQYTLNLEGVDLDA